MSRRDASRSSEQTIPASPERAILGDLFSGGSPEQVIFVAPRDRGACGPVAMRLATGAPCRAPWHPCRFRPHHRPYSRLHTGSRRGRCGSRARSAVECPRAARAYRADCDFRACGQHVAVRLPVRLAHRFHDRAGLFCRPVGRCFMAFPNSCPMWTNADSAPPGRRERSKVYALTRSGELITRYLRGSPREVPFGPTRNQEGDGWGDRWEAKLQRAAVRGIHGEGTTNGAFRMDDLTPSWSLPACPIPGRAGRTGTPPARAGSRSLSPAPAPGW